jgi:hypothetical protein
MRLLKPKHPAVAEPEHWRADNHLIVTGEKAAAAFREAAERSRRRDGNAADAAAAPGSERPATADSAPDKE